MKSYKISLYIKLGFIVLHSCFCMHSVHALSSMIFIPGSNIALTGSDTKVHFNVHEALSTSTTEGPTLATNQKKFHGGFYIDGIGWILLSTGSLQVELNCSEAINILTLPCTITGSGWSELTGEVGFSQMHYYPESGSLSGIIETHAGQFVVHNNTIYLPLKGITLNEDINALSTTDNQVFTVQSGSLLYIPGNWYLQDITTNHDAAPIVYSMDGNFSNIDITLADAYQFKIVDPNGSWTLISDIDVRSGNPSVSHIGGPENVIGTYCANYTDIAKCPDGSTLKPSHIEIIGSSAIADGKHFYTNTIKFRDEYGNPINQGTIRVYYTGTVSRIQKHQNTITPYDSGRENDGLVFEGISFTPDFLGNWRSEAVELNGLSEFSYNIGSLSPTDFGGHHIKFNSFDFELPSGTSFSGMQSAIMQIPLTFAPWIMSTTKSTNGNILINQENGFETILSPNTNARVDIQPDITTLMTIGTGSHAGYRNFISDSTIDCQAYPQNIGLYINACNWKKINNQSLPSVFSINTNTTFGFTGTYAAFTNYPHQEGTNYYTYLHYKERDFSNTLVDIIYPIDTDIFGVGTYGSSNIKIIGQNNAQGEYGTIITNGGMRAKFFDSIRKNTSNLSRNRTNYTGVNYIIHSGDITVNQSSFNTVRTIITIGGDIHVTSDLLNSTSHPYAIIALSDNEGNGGNINIDPSVTTVFSSIFAEKSMLTFGNKQLYINGTIVSANTLGDAYAQICPYHHIGPCSLNDAMKYDFEEMRKGYRSLAPGDIPTHQSTQSTAIKNITIPFIVEYDSRILQDPPPGV